MGAPDRKDWPAMSAAVDAATGRAPKPNLTPAQREALAEIVAAGPDGIVLDKKSTSANALVRKGLVTRVDVEQVPATKIYTARCDTHTIRGRLRTVTLARYTAVAAR